MYPTDKTARVAGAIYLFMVVTAPFSLIYIPNTLMVRGNAAATANNILAHEMLYNEKDALLMPLSIHFLRSWGTVTIVHFDPRLPALSLAVTRIV